MAILNPGEQVLIPDPGWPNVEMMVACAGGIAKHYPLPRESSFEPAIAMLETLVTERTKAIVINSPSNPTGTVFRRETVEALVDVAARHDLYLIADEVYEQIIFDQQHYNPQRFDPDGRVIGVHSFSKTYAMTGWRVGYVVASPPLARLITKLQEPFFSCASSVSQKAAEAALAGPQDCVDQMRQEYRRNRDLAISLLNEARLPFVRPQGTFYMLVDISRSGLGSDQFARALLQGARVAVAPGRAFGPSGEGYVRLSLASTPADIREGICRLAAFLTGAR